MWRSMRSQQLATAGLGGLAGLHAVWATGSPWPLADRGALADAVAGRRRFPSAGACVGVAGLLATAAAIVGGRPRRLPRLRRAGAAGVTAALAVRGALGLAGRTDLVSPGATSARFRSLDRRIYSPCCLTLAALSAPAARGRR
jgi:Protein of unknown function (DUF3995)